MVPDTGGRGVSGCYRVQGHLYGPYRMTFCLGRDSYHVTGAGLDCRAGLDWRRAGPGRVEIDLDYARCGRGAAWSSDSMTCRFDRSGRRGGDFNAEVVVPDWGGSVERLRCRYVPSEPGYRPVSITARRIG